MITYLSDILSKIQRFSEKLDNNTLLTNQHWVIIDPISQDKTTYIFRSNKELLISHNGKVEKAKWDYLGNNSILIDRVTTSYLYKQGFFDENILALKVDTKEEYAIFVNENKYSGEINTMEKVIQFLQSFYSAETLKLRANNSIQETKLLRSIPFITFKTDKGNIDFAIEYPAPCIGDLAMQNNKPAIDGKYKFGFMWYVHIYNGKVKDVTIF